MSVKAGLLLPLLVVVLSALLLYVPSPFRSFVLPDEESPSSDRVRFDESLQPFAATPTSLLKQGEDAYHFGRWKAPIKKPELHKINPLQKLFQQKDWHFIAIADGDGRRLYGFAVAQLQYASSAFIYVFDSATGHTVQKSFIIPLGFGATISSSSIEGCSNWTAEFTGLRISLCATKTLGWKIEADGILEDGTNIYFRATVGALRGSTEILALSYPIGPHRPSYTHKEAGTPARGLFRLGSTTTDFGLGDAVALIDWTRSMHKRLTVWFWVAITFRAPNGKTVGVNLSHGVYPNPNDQKKGDLENALWLDGKVYVIDSPLQVQGNPGEGAVQMGKTWTCSSEDGTINLSFVPYGAVDSKMNLGILSGNLIHTFGIYNGWLVIAGERFDLVNVVGILEDHYALW